ncbi:DUF4124 domain-containing protein [Aquisalimonas asiatica]|uniref:DUF4124 domain-containing protein n=1 Tax=Aquisalimonas asiatica TaxID=406100 RepID=A0A1H8VFG1_9GAMM|nr:DUF4124 domain-containing protein [Aquisalimonas asiatica]SEP14131.1 protein of unknown function [Aquisalimonas asiatica]
MKPLLPHRCACTLATLLVASLLAAPAGADGQLYRWTDDDGNVHYSDRLPADRAPDGRDVYDRSGRHLERIDAALSEEERALKREREAQEREAQALAEERAAEQADYDRMLRDTYTHPDDVRAARDERLRTLEATASLAGSRIERYRDELERLQDEAARLERQSDGDPAPAYERIDEVRERIARQERFIERREAEMADVRETFQGHLERLQELQARDN